MSNEEAEKYKSQGNEAMKNKNWDEAIKLYNKAITLDPDNAVYYSNRSAVWSSKGKYDSALSDAEKCLKADPNFVKGYSRKGSAYIGLGKMDEAKQAFEAGLAKDPENAGCKQGIQDVDAAKRRRAAASASSGGGGGMFGGAAGGILGTITEKMKKGGRLQMYMVLMVGYYLFTNLTGRGKSSSKSQSSSSPVTADDDEAYGDEPGKLVRGFADLEGRWVSYLQQQGANAEAATFMLLHRTSLSAEAEFGDAVPKLLPHAKRIVVPDRPCHGYSPCPEGGEGGDTSWLRTLLDKRGGGGGLWLAAAGREAARQALALARSRPEVSQVWLMSPRALAPSFPADVSQADVVRGWLADRSGNAGAVADAARWAVASGKGKEGKAAPSGALNVAKIPAHVKVTVLYSAQEEEDDDLRNSLEANNVAFEVRHGAASETLMDILVDEAQQRAEPAAEHGDQDDADVESTDHEEA